MGDRWGPEGPPESAYSRVTDPEIFRPLHGAAPLTVVFTEFPSVLVRLGGEYDDLRLPVCGCDACDEDVQGCGEELDRFLAVLVTGEFGERLYEDEQGWCHERWYGDPGRQGSRSWIRPFEADAVRRRLPAGERTWRPWPVRRGN